MKQNSSLSMAIEIMTEFANLTGMTQEGNVPRRYLWTDAFAVVVPYEGRLEDR